MHNIEIGPLYVTFMRTVRVKEVDTSNLPPGLGIIIWYIYAVIGTHTWFMGFSLMTGTILFFWFVYWLNQRVVRKELIPRKDELEQLLNSLKDSKE